VIAFDKCVISCEQYHSKLTGKMFAKFVKEHFSSVFENSANPRGKLFFQDVDPRQCSKVARKAIGRLGCRMFAIPPRSPDINPIENIFHLVRKQLQDDALRNKITKESFAAFSVRIKRTVKNITVETINKTILSMNKRMKLIVKGKCNGTKY
jgi:transposase